MKIHKYSIVATDGTVTVPYDEVLSVDINEYGNPCAWVLTKTKKDTKVFYIGTGHEVPKNAEYINTFKQGPFVWHAFKALD